MQRLWIPGTLSTRGPEWCGRHTPPPPPRYARPRHCTVHACRASRSQLSAAQLLRRHTSFSSRAPVDPRHAQNTQPQRCRRVEGPERGAMAADSKRRLDVAADSSRPTKRSNTSDTAAPAASTNGDVAHATQDEGLEVREPPAALRAACHAAPASYRADANAGIPQRGNLAADGGVQARVWPSARQVGRAAERARVGSCAGGRCRGVLGSGALATA